MDHRKQPAIGIGTFLRTKRLPRVRQVLAGRAVCLPLACHLPKMGHYRPKVRALPLCASRSNLRHDWLYALWLASGRYWSAYGRRWSGCATLLNRFGLRPANGQLNLNSMLS